MFGNWFNFGRSKSDNSATEPRQRRATVTDASTVAAAFGSGDRTQVADIMRRHEVRVVNSGGAKNEEQYFKVTERHRNNELTREDSSGNLHEMRTFHISAGANKKEENTFFGTYFPMTEKEQGWDQGGTGLNFQKQNAVVTRQQSQVALSTPLTACFVTDGPDGIGHMQPYKAPSTGTGTTREQDVAHYQLHNTAAGQLLSQQYGDVFGPREYGKWDTPKGRNFRAATAVVMADKTGQKHIMSQSIYGSDYTPEDQIIQFNTRPFGAPPIQHTLQIDRSRATSDTPPPLTRRHSGSSKSGPRMDIDRKLYRRGRSNSVK